ncbi:MAG: DUF1801 domain-containing protein [Arenibacterium sp.]
MRSIILNTASDLPGLTLLESLKWGQPSWLPDRPRIGSTLRVGWSEAHPNRISLYVHCQTTLAETMRDLYPDSFTYEGNRALHLDLTAPLPEQAIAHCATLPLTYHRRAT